MTKLSELLARVEATTGRDDDLSRALGEVLGATNANGTVNDFTGSTDAALALVDRVLPGQDVSLYRRRTGHTKVELNRWQVLAPQFAFASSSVQASTPSLAILAAVLRALIAQEDTQ